MSVKSWRRVWEFRRRASFNAGNIFRHFFLLKRIRMAHTESHMVKNQVHRICICFIRLPSLFLAYNFLAKKGYVFDAYNNVWSNFSAQARNWWKNLFILRTNCLDSQCVCRCGYISLTLKMYSSTYIYTQIKWVHARIATFLIRRAYSVSLNTGNSLTNLLR